MPPKVISDKPCPRNPVHANIRRSNVKCRLYYHLQLKVPYMTVHNFISTYQNIHIFSILHTIYNPWHYGKFRGRFAFYWLQCLDFQVWNRDLCVVTSVGFSLYWYKSVSYIYLSSVAVFIWYKSCQWSCRDPVQV